MCSNENNLITMDSALEAMSLGATVLTANRRLALELKRQHDSSQAMQGKHVWESANTVSWSDWMQSLFQDLVDLGFTDSTLLTPHQTHILWEQIIPHSAHELHILNYSSAAKMAQKARVLMQSWNIHTGQLAQYSNSEVELFLSWVAEFEKRSKEEYWLDASSIPGLIIDRFRDGTLTAPENIILAGFDEITPQHNSVLELLRDKGCQISSLISEQVENSVHRFHALDVTHEVNTAVRWAIKRLQSRPEARVGIVVPKLADFRRDVERVLGRCLDPVALQPGSNRSEKLYNISLGIPLAQCPLIVDAFVILHFAKGELSCDNLSRLLRSPFMNGYAEEGESRARLDAYIRSSLGEYEISLDTLIRKLREVAGKEQDSYSALLKSLETFRKRLDHLPVKQSPQQWTEEFQKLLNIFGWCRSEGMASIEYQQLEKFNKVFSSFQQLGHIQHSMRLQEALGHLHAIAAETLFQAQGSDAQIQVVGLLEAGGLKFDHLWVMGLSDENWPEPASPNPLLPISLQRKLGLPHASPQRELEYATAITQRLLCGAAEVVVSHATNDGKGQMRVSPLVAHLPQISLDELDIAQVTDPGCLGFGSAELEEKVDDIAPQLPTGTYLTGGSRLLADQSACPFSAFANHRLGANAIEEPVSGVDARIRGIITHRVLQEIWQQLGDQERLLSMDTTELRQLIIDVVSKELTRIKKLRPVTFATRFIEIEQQRLTELVIEWLELERQRTPFTVTSLEQRERVHLAGLVLDIVADRIDQLEDGNNLIIDYKTGKNLSFKGWFEQRIEEPQLPLYAIAKSEGVSGVCLAGVNKAKLGFKGVTDQDEVVPGVKAFTDTKESEGYAGWEDLKSEWKQGLELLAEEILAGRADVSPKDPSKTCLYCPLPSLCRIHEWGEES